MDFGGISNILKYTQQSQNNFNQRLYITIDIIIYCNLLEKINFPNSRSNSHSAFEAGDRRRDILIQDGDGVALPSLEMTRPSLIQTNHRLQP